MGLRTASSPFQRPWSNSLSFAIADPPVKLIQTGTQPFSIRPTPRKQVMEDFTLSTESSGEAFHLSFSSIKKPEGLQQPFRFLDNKRIFPLRSS